MQNYQRQEKIHQKGFDLTSSGVASYSKVAVGTKKITDVIYTLNDKINDKNDSRIYYNKNRIYRAIMGKDVEYLRQLSNYFYKSNGTYGRMCEYAANMYRYDWYIEPNILDSTANNATILKNFYKVLNKLDESHIRETCGRMRLTVIREGAYYGYIIKTDTNVYIQDLPVKYCRSRFTLPTGMPIVEINMRYFTESFPDVQYRLKVLQTFPKDIQKGYVLWQQKKLPTEVNNNFSSWNDGWYTLEPGSAIKFHLNDSDIPVFVNVIPSLIDLQDMQGLDRRKQMQELQKLIIQRLPLDKNGDLVFDLDEARDIHKNAVEMVAGEIGTDVLTTFAEIDVKDIGNTTQQSSTDSLERMERTVYNNFGSSRNLFNSTSNLALEKSVLDDESTFRRLLLQFQNFYAIITKELLPTGKKYFFNFYMLETTQYNYKELSKSYKEQVQLGNSKILPQLALGHSQSSILNTAYFENEVLKLHEIMIPPLTSTVMDSKQILGNKSQSSSSNSQNSLEDTKVGRPEKSNDEKSEKTIANKESM